MNSKEIRFAKSHEWVKKDGEQFLLGISEYAQDQLGDIVFVDFPEVGDHLDAQETLGELESSKAVSEINIPFSGEITEINQELEDSPESINTDPYGSWIVKFKADNPEDFNNLKEQDSE